MVVKYTSKVEHPSNCQGQGAVIYGQYALNFKYQTLLYYLRISSQWHTIQTAFELNPTNSTSGGIQAFVGGNIYVTLDDNSGYSLRLLHP